jgi:molybdopterin synthase sulfur carrier subunit
MKIKYFAYIRNYAGCKETDFERCQTVEELLSKLCSIYGKGFERIIFKNNELSSEIIILVNGRHISHLNGIKTPLEDSDEISIFPEVAGG